MCGRNPVHGEMYGCKSDELWLLLLSKKQMKIKLKIERLYKGEHSGHLPVDGDGGQLQGEGRDVDVVGLGHVLVPPHVHLAPL